MRAYERSPIAFDDLLDRVLGPTPAHGDVLAGYLFLPRIRLSYHADPHHGVPMKVRSSLEAAYTDASLSDGAWLATIGFLVLFDQIGTALERTDRPTQGGSSVELALERFSGVQEAERAALYALRCALAHDFSLVNLPPTSTKNSARRAQLTHAFVLHGDSGRPLVEFPRTP